MQRDWKSRIFLAAAVVAVGALPALAQSSSRNPARGSGHADQSVAMEGYCPVCIIEAKKWMRGNSQHAVRYDGKVYSFPGEDQKQMFLANPAKYAPALGGDCTVCFAEMKERVPGSIRHAAFYKNRLFLFPSGEQKGMFAADPARYDKVDLALDGLCAVCMVEMNERVEGKPEFAVVHQGMRYFFPSAKQRDMFLADPAKYAARPADTAKQASLQRFSATDQIVSVRGRSGCAACDHGVHPLGAKDELGLAVNSDDGTVYVVEDAHTLYPQLYEDRFEGLPLDLAGTVLKREGKFVWVKPQSVRVIR